MTFERSFGDEICKIARVLSVRGRNQIKAKNFALPGERYPIHDRAHARNALTRVSQFGSAGEQAKVRARVHAKYPGIGKEGAVPILDPVMDTAIEMGREIDRTIEKHEKPVNVALGAGLGGGLGAPLGALAGSAIQMKRLSDRVMHPDEDANFIRKWWHYRQNMPRREVNARELRRMLRKGALVGGATGVGLGGLMGWQVAKALERSRKKRAS